MEDVEDDAAKKCPGNVFDIEDARNGEKKAFLSIRLNSVSTQKGQITILIFFVGNAL